MAQKTPLRFLSSVPCAFHNARTQRLAHIVIKTLRLDPNIRLGRLSDAYIKSLREAVENPVDVGIPQWMFNRRKDRQTGEDIHLIASNLITRQRNDIEVIKEMGSWKRVHHELGLKVRGQRAKTTARKGRVIGVSRRRIRREQREKP